VNRDPDAPHIERTLELNLRQHPEDARGIEKVLSFRKRVREEFDRLVRELEKAAASRSLNLRHQSGPKMPSKANWPLSGSLPRSKTRC
jgi:hypothetical protein